MENRQPSGQIPIAVIIGRCAVRLWGLTGEERLTRQLRAAGIASAIGGGDGALCRRDREAIASNGALLLRADFLFDQRTLQQMLSGPDTMLEAADGEGRTVLVAACVAAAHVAAVMEAMVEGGPAPHLEGVTRQSAAELRSSYVAGVLKADRPLLLPIRRERVAELESYLYAASYKGVTDLVTKWVWPLPAMQVVRWCTRYRITPNAVTTTGLALVIAATWLFAHGYFAAGLVPAWLMTFLDTVDGKLARVTVTSTRFGHYLDHGTDLVHPPLWYAAWGAGVVGGIQHLEVLTPTLLWILAGYVAGRIAEGVFKHLVAGFSMFTWQPFDSYFRLVTGRRNPNLILLTASVMVGDPAAGLTAVAVWTVVSTLILIVRTCQGMVVRLQGRPMSPWLEAFGPAGGHRPRYAQPFVPDGAALARLAR
ncbi:MAG TPA: CDP-alcohol phosphatidyltransferase family protein [Candidatus Binatia bacterium]|nr:CDP-alcohol phosphatidyltransferase family protein [Candidatus Binatia bacterium]